jgi:hypothetical protein
LTLPPEHATQAVLLGASSSSMPHVIAHKSFMAPKEVELPYAWPPNRKSIPLSAAQAVGAFRNPGLATFDAVPMAGYVAIAVLGLREISANA